MKQLPWTLCVLALALVVWLSLAVVSTENQRNALVSKSCADPMFKGEVDAKCLATVQTRAYWWQHLAYAMTHIRA